MNNKISSYGQQSHLTNSSIGFNKRTALKMVRSTFEPPQQTQASYNYAVDQKSQSASRKSKDLNSKDSELDNQSQQLNNFNPGIQFIASLVTLKELTTFDEGDCIPFNSDDRWLVVSGELKIVGTNGCSFVKKQGFVFFASAQTKMKIKEVIAISPTTAFRIPYAIFKESIRNYLYIKNSEKIKFLQQCPFLSWSQSLSQDMAIAMEYFQPQGKDVMIYKEGEESDYLYFVKEGIVLLQRNGKAGNQIILDFEKHYQTSYLNQQQGLIIVRKGMIFGVDGILIKQINNQVDLLSSQNPEDSRLRQNIRPYQQQADFSKLKTTRIYNAKSIGKCELYKLDKNSLQTYLKAHAKQSQNQAHISNKQLDRICLQYTNLLMGSKNISKQVKKKNFQFKISMDETMVEQITKKKKKVQQIKHNQKRVKKISSNTHLDSKKNETIKQTEEYPLIRPSPRKSKVESESKIKDLSLPSLNRKNMENLIMKKLQMKQAQQYIGYKKKIDSIILGKESKHEKDHQPNQKHKKQLEKVENLQFMKVRSYRSLLSSLS